MVVYEYLLCAEKKNKNVYIPSDKQWKRLGSYDIIIIMYTAYMFTLEKKELVKK